MKNYEDMIYLRHPTSNRHSRMTQEMRAAQFSPFSALSGYDEYLYETQKIIEEKKILDESQQDKINEILSKINCSRSNYLYIITYFKKDSLKEGGNYITITDIIKRLDMSTRCLITINHGIINIDDIYEIMEIAS